MAPVLLSRALDAGLGILTGIGAYYLHETHPRSNIPHEARLQELIKWKWAKYWAQPPPTL
ncbi:hypothetical protein B0H16DRAFT_1508856 [Mycena metata]|uniref:Uncharacterized protein n=1 Tax=Mycena metata TaxID=1033252 RepID=A0AAD7NTN8_9AGAR|nr:hypothetical protein B0H16DRAFT_1508856 [Mycena metata]